MTLESAPASSFHVVTAVWGAEFIDLFLNVCVPNQLSARNLPALPHGSRYRVFTRPSDVTALAASARLDEVRAVMPVDIVAVDVRGFDATKGGQNRYKLMTACHRRAIEDAAGSSAAMIFLSPDFVLAEGTLAALAGIHERGSRAVLTTGLRLARTEFVGALSAHGAGRALAPRDLVQLAMRHLHPSTTSLMIDGPTANEFPTLVCWPVRSDSGAVEGVLTRALHLHPLMLDPVYRDVVPRHTIDGHYIMEACPDASQCHVVDDSDELVVFELTRAETVVGTDIRGRGVSRLRLAAVAATCNAHQLSYFQRPILLHTGELDVRWADVETQSERFVQELARYRLAGRVLITVYRWRKLWRRRSEARVRAVRRASRHYVRAVLRTVRGTLRRREAYARALRRAIWPRGTAKRMTRRAKLAYHSVSKTGRQQLKRLRRHVRRFRPA